LFLFFLDYILEAPGVTLPLTLKKQAEESTRLKL
jgi:hypothetical protein